MTIVADARPPACTTRWMDDDDADPTVRIALAVDDGASPIRASEPERTLHASGGLRCMRHRRLPYSSGKTYSRLGRDYQPHGRCATDA